MFLKLVYKLKIEQKILNKIGFDFSLVTPSLSFLDEENPNKGIVYIPFQLPKKIC